MNTFISKIKYDYFQRTRNYSFLITLCLSLAIAYTFVPEPNAGYSTIRIDNYVGYYNSAWFGYVTAIMTSIFLFLSGFYLVNNGIQTDSDTKVGLIIASTRTSNFTYLLSKMVSNFLVLFTIVCLVFGMSIVLFFLYNDGYPFEFHHFIKPYIFVTLPSMLIVSSLAVVFEVFLGKYSTIQNVLFFFLFFVLLLGTFTSSPNYLLDFFGNEIVTSEMESNVNEITRSENKPSLSIGFIVNGSAKTQKFLFSGLNFPREYILSRMFWTLVSFGMMVAISPFFHRFDVKEKITEIKKKFEALPALETQFTISQNLPKLDINFSLLPLIKTELLLLFRKGHLWPNILTLVGIMLLAFTPITLAHQIILPIVWFLQVTRISELVTKESTYHFENLAYASYKPLMRLLSSQLISGVMFILAIASPLILRLLLDNQYLSGIMVILGGVFIVLLAALLGMLTKGKKLFEILFFMISYANINKVPFLDYFGGLAHSQLYAFKILTLCLILLISSVLLRNFSLRNN